MRVGPATITSSCTPTIIIPDAAVTVGCAATVTNSSKSQMAIDWNSATPGGAGQATGNLNHKMLAPGESVQLAVPPAGQVWNIAFVSGTEVRKLADLAGVILLTTLALAAYGAVSAYRDFAPRVKRWAGREVRRLR